MPELPVRTDDDLTTDRLAQRRLRFEYMSRAPMRFEQFDSENADGTRSTVLNGRKVFSAAGGSKSFARSKITENEHPLGLTDKSGTFRADPACLLENNCSIHDLTIIIVIIISLKNEISRAKRCAGSANN